MLILIANSAFCFAARAWEAVTLTRQRFVRGRSLAVGEHDSELRVFASLSIIIIFSYSLTKKRNLHHCQCHDHDGMSSEELQNLTFRRSSWVLVGMYPISQGKRNIFRIIDSACGPVGRGLVVVRLTPTLPIGVLLRTADRRHACINCHCQWGGQCKLTPLRRV